jgi:hypothetical protein
MRLTRQPLSAPTERCRLILMLLRLDIAEKRSSRKVLIAQGTVPFLHHLFDGAKYR